MRARLERLMRRWWAGELGKAGRAAAALAAPVGGAWGAAAAWHARRLAGRAERVGGLAVVSVGNLAVGGTGKTPLAAWVAARLEELGARPCLIVGGNAPDEARLHERWSPAVLVLEGRDRVEAARRAARAGHDVAVLDDGFQHVRLARDLDVVTLSAEDPFPGATLPAGPYRERPEALARADVVVLTRRRAPAEAALALAAAARRYAPGARLAGLALVPGGWRDLEGAPREPPAGPVLAACAVARPDAFAAAVRARVGGEVELAAFADHHPFGRADARRLRARARGRPVVLTEKDAVKLAPHADALGPAWVLADALRWEWGEDEVREALASVLAGASAR